MPPLLFEDCASGPLTTPTTCAALLNRHNRTEKSGWKELVFLLVPSYGLDLREIVIPCLDPQSGLCGPTYRALWSESRANHIMDRQSDQSLARDSEYPSSRPFEAIFAQVASGFAQVAAVEPGICR